MSIIEYLNLNARKYSKKVALVIDEKEYTYEELSNLVNKIISVLRKNKISHKSVVLLIEDNTLSHVCSLFALSYINACIVPASTYYSFDHLKKLAEIAKVNAIVGNSKYCLFFKKNSNITNLISTNKTVYFPYLFNFEKLKKFVLLKKINCNKNYIVSLSSGSTGNPKPIIFSQNTKIQRFNLMKNLYDINFSDKIILTCPLDHSLGMRILFLSVLSGATIVIMNKFLPKKYIDLTKKHSITFSILVANQIYDIAKDNSLLKSLYLKKGLVSASASLNNSTKKKIIKQGLNLFEMYGASEVGTVTSINLKKEKKSLKSVGKIYNKLIKVKILSKKNKILPKNKVGEIICTTPGIFKGYLGPKKINKDAFHGKFFKTGDIGYLDKKGYLYYLGRKKNIIRRSGITVYPEDIENTLLLDKNIKEVAVLGKQKNMSDNIYVFIKKEKNINHDYVQKICLKKLSTFQLPNKIFLIDNLPKSNLGKINKSKLKKYLN